MPTRRKISYPLSLALVVAVLVVLSGGWIAWWNYRSGLANARAIANTLFEQVAQSTATSTADFLMRAPPAAATLRDLAATDAAPLDRLHTPCGSAARPGEAGACESDALAHRFLAVLRANPGFSWVSYSDAAGTFTGVHRTPDGKLVVNQSHIADGKTALVEREVQGETWAPLRTEADTKYDPRTRPFYQLAQEAQHGVWTPPYVFAEHLPGITYALPVGTGGVITIDFDLRRLSDVVKALRFSEHGRVAVISDRGLALAHPTATLITSDAEPRLIRADEIDDPALRAQLASADARQFTLGDTPYLAAAVAIPIPDGPAWRVLAYAPESDFTTGLQDRVTMALVMSLGAVLIAVLLAAFLARRVSGPLTSLAADMVKVGAFELTETPPRESLFKEIAMMNSALIKMKGGLRSFARYVPRDLVRAVIASGQEAVLAGDVRELTVYFSDIAGFTTIAERMKPDELVRFLGEYLEDMTRIITDERGTVDKFLGDGIMAFWGAPTALPDHAARACVAALRCQRRVRELAEAGTTISARIGIATGDVLVGNIGAPERMNYTVMGDTANLAARLESLNKQYGTSLMISEATYARAKDAVVARPIDIVAVKGKQQGVYVYELLALRDEHDAEAEAIAADSIIAIDAYVARDFTTAIDAWDRVLAKLPHDRAATTLRDRAVAYRAIPPDITWTGVTIATEK